MRVFILAAMAAGAAGAALAQEAPLTRVYACAAVEKADERLACFDAAVAGLKQSEASGGVAVVSREQITEAEKKAFGLGPATLSDMARNPASAAPAQPAPLENMQVTITEVSKRAGGLLRLTLANGQVWEEYDDSFGRLGGLPLTAEIRKGALGGFMIKVGERPMVRVRRVK